MDQELLDLIAEHNGSEHDALIVLWERLKRANERVNQLAFELAEYENAGMDDDEDWSRDYQEKP